MIKIYFLLFILLAVFASTIKYVKRAFAVPVASQNIMNLSEAHKNMGVEQLVDFVNKNRGSAVADTIIAGISPSGAQASFCLSSLKQFDFITRSYLQ